MNNISQLHGATMPVESAKPPAIDDDEFENLADYNPENDAKDDRSLKKQIKSKQKNQHSRMD